MGNPPELVSRMFREAIEGAPLQKVDFCIFDDHNSGHCHNPRGNFIPFREMFEDWIIADLDIKPRKTYIKKQIKEIEKRLKQHKKNNTLTDEEEQGLMDKLQEL